jgi:hypothetical protein
MMAYLCSFSGSHYDALKPRERGDYDKVKAAVLADGRFSSFDASATPRSARMFDRLGADPTVVFDREASAYPWVVVRAATS